MRDIEVVFQIISYAGEAKSCYIEATEMAENKKFKEAQDCIQKGDDAFTFAHKVHFQLIQKEANEEQIELGLLLIHAEDQLMSCETLKIMAEKFITLYQRMGE